jgi:heme-degrading monooxygenase HmoA
MGDYIMFVVMNRLPVNPDYADQFEERFTNRAREVDKMPGFIRNQVLRPGNSEDPYIVLTMWEARQNFEEWINSEEFKRGHAKSGTLPPETFLGHGKLETFEIILDTALD